jgi:hypothetical protein
MRNWVIPAGLFGNVMIEHVGQGNKSISPQLTDVDSKKPTTDNESELFEIVVRKSLKLWTYVTNRLIVTFHVSDFSFYLL